MSAPIEFRLFAKKFTMDDLRAGVQPMRDGPEFYCPAIIQYRYKQRLSVAGRVETEWSEWQFIPFVKEGDGVLAPPAGADGSAA